jgi:RNA polymerase sigma-70 factor (ECF subfamily)
MLGPLAAGKTFDESLASDFDAARRGSGEALGRLLDGCREYLQLVANQEMRANLQPKLGASDLVQETFLDAQRGFGRFTGQTEAELLAWLRQILLHNLRDADRRFRRSLNRQAGREIPFAELALGIEPASDRTTDASPSWPIRCDEQTRLLHEALSRLSADHRRVIILRNLELRSFIEIGKVMNRSPDAARKLWVRALDELQIAMRGCDVL